MADRNTIEQTLRAAYAARLRGDVDGILQHFSPHARFAMAGAAQASPVAMRVDGADQLRSALEGMVKTFVMLDHQVVAMLVDGDNAAVHWRSTIRSSVTGETVTTEACDLITTKDGKIVSFLEFCDTAAAAQLMGRG